MKVTLYAQEDSETGELGWRHEKVSRYSNIYGPLSWMPGLAHDILEHFAFEHVGDEIEAHGAMYRIRYEGGWSSPKYANTLTPDTFANEWVSLFNGTIREEYIPTPRNTRPLDSYIEQDIDYIISQGRKIVRDEFAEGSDDELQQATLNRIEEVFRAYFRIGYRKARKRYKGIAMCYVAGLYNTLAEHFEHEKPEYEGQEILVKIDPKRGLVNISQVELDEYGY